MSDKNLDGLLCHIWNVRKVEAGAEEAATMKMQFRAGRTWAVEI